MALVVAAVHTSVAAEEPVLAAMVVAKLAVGCFEAERSGNTNLLVPLDTAEEPGVDTQRLQLLGTALALDCTVADVRYLRRPAIDPSLAH